MDINYTENVIREFITIYSRQSGIHEIGIKIKSTLTKMKDFFLW